MPSVPKELKGIIPPRRVNKKKRRKRITESARKKFKKEFLEAYKEEGISMDKAAGIVGFSRQGLYKWAEADPEFAAEFEKLRFIKKNKSEKEWKEKHKHDEEYKKKFLELYSDETYSAASALTEISEDINKTDFDYWLKTDFEFKKEYKTLQQKLRPTIAKGVELRSAVVSAKVQEKQKQFITAYTENHFNITGACKVIGITRQTLKTWCNSNPDFNAALDAAQDEKEDWAEDKLFALAEEGNTAAIIFLMKILGQRANIGRRHTYVEQPQKIEGRIEHVHKWDQEQIDAAVRGNQTDRIEYGKMLGLDDPNTVDAEYESVE